MLNQEVVDLTNDSPKETSKRSRSEFEEDSSQATIRFLKRKLEFKDRVIDERNRCVGMLNKSLTTVSDKLSKTKKDLENFKQQKEDFKHFHEVALDEIEGLKGTLDGVNEDNDRLRNELVLVKRQLRETRLQEKSLWTRVLRDNPDESCPICCDLISNNESTAYSCGHLVHEECFVESVNRGYIGCTLCNDI
jgi:chromosome segregation ATPase